MSENGGSAAPARLDLSQVADRVNRPQEEGREVKVYVPGSTTEVVMTVRVAGPDSERAIRARQSTQDAARRAGRVRDLSQAEIEDRALQQFAHWVISWDAVDGGKEIPCTPANVAQVLRRFPFIREKLEAEVSDRVSFMTA